MHAGRISENKQDYKIVEYITKNFSEDLKACDLSEKFNISVIDLNKAVKSQVARSFYDFLNFLRINRACELLLESEMNITEIAIEVGYNTVKTFRRNFVEQRHMTPVKFREMVVMENK